MQSKVVHAHVHACTNKLLEKDKLCVAVVQYVL